MWVLTLLCVCVHASASVCVCVHVECCSVCMVNMCVCVFSIGVCVSWIWSVKKVHLSQTTRQAKSYTWPPTMHTSVTGQRAAQESWNLFSRDNSLYLGDFHIALVASLALDYFPPPLTEHTVLANCCQSVRPARTHAYTHTHTLTQFRTLPQFDHIRPSLFCIEYN